MDREQALNQAKKLFAQGQTAYRLGAFKGALGHFQAALKITSRPSIVLNIAQCHRQLGHTNQALFNYKLYLTQWKRANPDRPSPYAAEVSKHIAELEALALRSSRSSLRLVSQPAGASIWLDGRELSMTSPITLRDLSPGKHSVVLRKEALFFRGTVDLQPGQQTELVATLQRVRAEVSVTSTPSGATVRLNNVLVGRTPLKMQLPVGQNTLELAKEGLVTARRLVKVDGPGSLKVDVTLVQLGVIVVTSEPPGATVFVDGRGSGVTPAELPAEPGQHKVRLVMTYREDVEREVTVEAGQTLRLEEKLGLKSSVREQLSKRKTMRALGWTSLALGIAGMVGGAVVILAGQVIEDEAHRDYLEFSVQSRMDEKYAEMQFGRDLRTYGIITASVGTAALITAVLLVTLAPDEPGEGLTLSLAPAPGGSGAAFSLGGVF